MAEIYANLEKVAELPIRGAKKLGEKLLAEKPNADLSYTLATIKTDVELNVTTDQLLLGESQKDQLIEYFARYEFKRWLNEVMNGADSITQTTEQPVKMNQYQATSQDQSAVENTPKIQIDRTKYETLLTQADLTRWIEKLNTAKLIAVDTETDSLDYMSANLVGISFALENGEAAYLPLQLDYLDAPKTLEKSTALAAIKPILENPNIRKIGQNIKFDESIFARHGIELQGVEFDTMLLSYTLNSTGRHNMDDLAKRYLGHETIAFESIAGKGKSQLTFNQIPLEQSTEYAAEDADVTMKLQQALWLKLQEEPTLVELYKTMELPLLHVLSRMERTGVLIDSNALFMQSNEIATRLTALEEQAYALAGQPFNLASTKQLQEILFDKLGLPVLQKRQKVRHQQMKKYWKNYPIATNYPKFWLNIVG